MVLSESVIMYEFETGQEVRLLYDVVSDGTVYGVRRGDLLVRYGLTGNIIRRGIFLDDVVYDVHFIKEDRIIGCREHELISADAPWSPPVYQKKDSVTAAADLTKDGKLLISAGTTGTVTSLRFYEEIGYAYEVKFEGDISLVVRESQITASVM